MTNDNRDSVCDDCAREMGYRMKDKQYGAWVGKCDFCGREKTLTSLSHDWRKAR